MRRFCVVTNVYKDKEHKTTERLVAYLEKRGAVVYPYLYNQQEEAQRHELPVQDCDAVIVLGGDGTMLQAAWDLHQTNIPMIGVNLGTLGYLAEVEVEHIEAALDKLLEDRFEIEERMMLQGVVYKNQQEFLVEHALNDIVIARSRALRVINMDVYVNGQFLSHFSSDGILVASATGSTAYNFSAGGPIVKPDARLMILTPICSHTINRGSIVLSSQDCIEIVIGRAKDGSMQNVEVGFDGRSNVILETGDRVVISEGKFPTRIVKTSSISFLETLRKKMSVQ